MTLCISVEYMPKHVDCMPKNVDEVVQKSLENSEKVLKKS